VYTSLLSTQRIALLAAAAVAAAACVWGWRWYVRHRDRRALVATITAAAFDHLQDVLVPDGNGGSFHVDFLLLTPSGILVVDLREVTGNVFGGDQMNEWTVMNGAQRKTFANPLSSLYDRVAAVKAVAIDVPVEGRIVFTGGAVFPKGLPKWTVHVDALTSDFPLADRAAFAGVVEKYLNGWEQAKRATAPSQLAHPRPLGGV
jgi:hypothetical protein